MSWFRRDNVTKLTTPEKKLRIPEGLFTKCNKCESIVPKADYIANMYCCTNCGNHGRIDSKARLALLLDEGTFVEHDRGLSSVDPLGFSDRKRYRDRIKEYQKSSRLVDAVRCGVGAIDGMEVSIAVMDFDFVGGSMGSVVGEKVTRAIERGLERHIPVIIVSTSGGARMQEGVLSLMQLAKSSAALARLSQARIPFISILTHPTTAGVMASYASLGDVIMAEPDALIGFAGPRVIEQTINEVLPKGFQRSSFVLDHGFIDIVCPRVEMRRRLANVLRVLRPTEVAKSIVGESAGRGKRPAAAEAGNEAAGALSADIPKAPRATSELLAEVGKAQAPKGTAPSRVASASPARAQEVEAANRSKTRRRTAVAEVARAARSEESGDADLHGDVVFSGAGQNSRGTRRRSTKRS
jgi:acetyl-CoA carboxylase carboxyl transferase subunit beta